jgi:glycosyltransferase involved in cell wall biosynthesis
MNEILKGAMNSSEAAVWPINDSEDQSRSRTTPRLYLGGLGDPNDSATYSGTAFHLLAAAKRVGLIEEGLPTRVLDTAYRARRAMWNLKQALSGNGIGGYQNSDWFLKSLYRPYLAKLHGNALLSFSQLLPQAIVEAKDVEKWYFIDMTCRQLLDHYGTSLAGPRTVGDVLRREEKGYRAARMVIANSRWAAESLLGDYKLDPGRVAVVAQAANFDLNVYRRWELEAVNAGKLDERNADSLRCVFVGKYWQRKGLDRLIRGFAIARRGGFTGTLRVIGVLRDELPSTLREVAGIEWIGFLDKTRSEDVFVRCVGDCDIGCLLSRAEAGGIALREYGAMGLIVLGTDAGGAADQTFPESSIILPVEAADDCIAGELLKLQNDPVRYRRMKDVAWQKRHEALWDHVVDQIAHLWGEAHPSGISK